MRMKIIAILLSVSCTYASELTVTFMQETREVRVTWDENAPEEDVTGYRIYYGQTSRHKPGFTGYGAVEDVMGRSVTERILSDDFVTNAKYYFAMTAFNDSLESDWSDEVSLLIVIEEDNDTPFPPVDVILTSSSGEADGDTLIVNDGDELSLTWTQLAKFTDGRAFNPDSVDSWNVLLRDMINPDNEDIEQIIEPDQTEFSILFTNSTYSLNIITVYKEREGLPSDQTVYFRYVGKKFVDKIITIKIKPEIL